MPTPARLTAARLPVELPPDAVVDVEGPLHFSDFGGSGPPMVLLHGIGGCRYNWLPAAWALRASHRVFALDLLGFGRTPEGARGVGFDAQQRAVDGFLRRVARAPAVLVGNSMGGLVALMQAARAPDSVARL
ncbi:MAG: alpha/beta fold hydrolase, partial [Myxococcales bacterium]